MKYSWNWFLRLLEKNNLLKGNDDFCFSGDFGDITEYGKTVDICGFYSSVDNFYFDLYRQGTGNTAQVQITPNQNSDKYINEKLMIKIVFSNIEIS